ncbi:MAG: helicase associated domain-containing protein [Chryseolinea sp.]
MTTSQQYLKVSKPSQLLVPIRRFFAKHGHIHVPNLPEYEFLFDLCNRLRRSKSQQPNVVINELDDMGFLWDLNLSNELRWYYHYEKLKAFHSQFGHTRVPARADEYKMLGVWVLRQRKNEKVLPANSKKLLNSIGFEWAADIIKAKDEAWKSMFKRLKVFHKRYGHSNVSDGYKEDEKLGRWVSTVRSREKHLEPWKKKSLKTLKFSFHEDIKKRKEASRKLLFSKLKKFYEKHGHVNVPEGYTDLKLAIAVGYLRQYPDRITSSEKKQLKSWNFLLSTEIKAKWEQLWLRNFKKLERFKIKYGHCRVSSSFNDQQLARWVASQRVDKKSGKLPLDRERKLRSVGFAFYDDIAALQESNWKDQYKKLLRFKKLNGSTSVPESYTDKKLVYWVGHQRRTKDRMGVERRRLLNRLKFVWKVKDSSS